MSRKTVDPGASRIPALLPEKLAFTIQEAVKAAGIGQTSLYKAIRDKQLTARKYGTRTIITRSDLQSFLNTLPTIDQ
ncbi:helix-turn-helix domain-containing protein [Bradyrhizobium tropiciagri]|uniref:helix-turn-helix domain-containing protein n=1 Tax=Bradyrhizobium tropiciagri TaxID=312253 RepID=UPI001BABCEE3|nr:helix-turn-helix domain-containing protein [Bradyrhizobium tropiciagri]MBR0900986.1 helix-turn-helix domain-containing protein [Bradyrhizobium tropiciagri]